MIMAGFCRSWWQIRWVLKILFSSSWWHYRLELKLLGNCLHFHALLCLDLTSNIKCLLFQNSPMLTLGVVMNSWPWFSDQQSQSYLYLSLQCTEISDVDALHMYLTICLVPLDSSLPTTMMPSCTSNLPQPVSYWLLHRAVCHVKAGGLSTLWHN